MSFRGPDLSTTAVFFYVTMLTVRSKESINIREQVCASPVEVDGANTTTTTITTITYHYYYYYYYYHHHH